jgi:hypothetical protein
MRYLKEQKEFYDEVERIYQQTDGIAEMQDEIANDPNAEPSEEEASPILKPKALGKRKKSTHEPCTESKRSSPRIKMQSQSKKKPKHSETDKESVNSKKGLLIPILASQKKEQKKGLTGYALFCSEFKTLVKTQYKNSKFNPIEGQKGAPTQKQISKAAADRWQSYSESQKAKYEKMAMKKESKVLALDCSDSESETKKGQKIKPRLKKDYLKQQSKQVEISHQFSEDFNLS